MNVTHIYIIYTCPCTPSLVQIVSGHLCSQDNWTERLLSTSVSVHQDISPPWHQDICLPRHLPTGISVYLDICESRHLSTRTLSTRMSVHLDICSPWHQDICPPGYLSTWTSVNRDICPPGHCPQGYPCTWISVHQDKCNVSYWISVPHCYLSYNPPKYLSIEKFNI